ncbi:hypothetical protein [Modestobacter sp. NPDC049651]|uniref:hypothetical protein n=1 Tax=Modestobacter sp. NPDC049651 TaxID=3155777 RepID=UPI0033E517A1
MTLDKQALLEKYPDAAWRENLLEVTALVGLLHNSIIDDTYKPSDELNSAIALSSIGDKVAVHLQRRESVPTKEARLLCLLVTAHEDPLIDVDRIDIGKLSQAISGELLKGTLLYPYVFGRQLYDRFADLHEEERHHLLLDETIQLLQDQPIGIFQERFWITGPFGLLWSDQVRTLSVERWVPLRHCVDLTCDAVHQVHLDSSDEAPVNKYRSKIHRHLERGSKRAWQWASFIRDIGMSLAGSYDDLNTGSLPYLLGDSLTLPELRILFGQLLDSNSGLRSKIAALRLRGPSVKIAESLDQARLLQLILLLKDSVIVEALDACVQDSKIVVPRTEVRRPVVNADRHAGAWGVQVELGYRGVRIAAASSDVPTLRLQRLTSELYGVEVASSAEDLEWLLREVDGPSLEARLAEFLRTTTPSEVIGRLIAMRKEKVLGTAKHLRFALPESSGDDEVIEHVLWRLGLMADDPSDPHESYWKRHAALEQRLTTAAVSPLLDEEAIRSLAANYFVALEGLLDDALHFSAWVLTHDHFASAQPFVFRPSVARRHSTTYLNELAKGVADPQPDYSDERASLYSLCLGFKLLGDRVATVVSEADDHLRPAADRPERFQFTALQSFPFNHVLPFLDLQPEARDRVIHSLREVGRVLMDSRISEIRNQQLHFRRSRADSDRFIQCLRAAREAVHLLEVSGLTRVEFGFEGHEVDQWGRSSVRLRDSRGKEVTFARPSRFRWCGLPDLEGRQYLVTSATFAEPNEMFRFVLQEESLFSSAYDGYPRRPKRRERAILGEGDKSDAQL